MPKTKIKEVKTKTAPTEETKEILLDDEEKTVDPELMSGDALSDEDEDAGVAEDEEVDPFKDRWEE